jgi:formylglycine-generating enzyme required for sulfatase activity
MNSFVLGSVIAAATVCLSAAEPTPSAETYAPGQDCTVVLPADVALDLVWIPAGSFLMGSPNCEGNSLKWEHPQTIVKISQGFWMGKTPVTQAQYRVIMGDNPSHFDKAGADAPVEQVTWDMAMDFCRKLTEHERTSGRLRPNCAFTLPSEAQWEYACRAGTTGPRYAENLFAIAWYGDSAGSTHPVGQKLPNAFGLYDMLGNVWQWCSDWFGAYPGGSLDDPTGPAVGNYRVCRGGSWWSGPADCRSASRYWETPGYRYNELLGFRVAFGAAR